MKDKGKKKRKINYKKIFQFLFFFLVLFLVIFIIINTPITNIYIKGNTYLSDQEIIRLAELEDYPSNIKNTSYMIKKRLEKSDMIINATIKKKGTKIYIDINENRPLFYNSTNKVIVMLDKKEKQGDIITPYLLNYVPDTVYDKFIDAIAKIDISVLNRMSDIEYKPNDIDAERFYINMTDGNYVYLTIRDFEKINNYIEMIKQFQGKKGILYLDSGEYFEIKE